MSKPVLMTPTQAIEAGVPEELVKMYASRSSSGHKLVEDDGSALKKVLQQTKMEEGNK